MNIKKIGYAVVTACFLTPIFCIGTLSVVAEKPTFSDIENRELAAAPELFKDGAVNQNYYSELEKFFSDTFPSREKLLTINRKIQSIYTNSLFLDDEAVFVTVSNTNQSQSLEVNEKKVSENEVTENKASENEVAENKASENEVTGNEAGENKVAENEVSENEVAVEAVNEEEYDEFVAMPVVDGRTFEVFDYFEERTNEFIKIIDRLADESGVPTYVIMPPAASELYFPYKYRKPENDQKQAIDLIGDSLQNATFVDLYDDFHAQKDDYIYFRADHHWTADGAYIAYKNFIEATGGTPISQDDMDSGRLDNFLGSLYKKISQSAHSEILKKNPDYVNFYYPLYDTKIFNYSNINMTVSDERKVLYPDYDKDTNLYNVFFGGDMILMYMNSGVANGKSIMVVRDSYGHAFLPFLANNYEHIYAVEPRYFTSFPLAEFIDKHDIDELVFLGYSLPATSKYWMNWVNELNKLTRAQ